MVFKVLILLILILLPKNIESKILPKKTLLQIFSKFGLFFDFPIKLFTVSNINLYFYA